jgi:hypothetical protein
VEEVLEKLRGFARSEAELLMAEGCKVWQGTTPQTRHSIATNLY